MLREKLQQAVEALSPLSESGLIRGFALIGGLAVSTWSTPRATVDVDLLLLVDLENLNRCADALRQSGIDLELRKGGAEDPVPYLIRAVNLDIIVATKKLEREAVRHAVPVDIGTVTVPVVPAEHLLLMKLRAGGPKDLLDAADLYRSGSVDPEVLHELARQFGCTRLLQLLEKDTL